MSAVGVLAGGVVADRTHRHGDVAAFGFGGAAVLILAVGVVNLGPILVVAAIGGAGRVFGIVTTGFNIGGTLGPLIGGWIMDRNLARWVLFPSVLFAVMTSVMALASEWRLRRRSALAISQKWI